MDEGLVALIPPDAGDSELLLTVWKRWHMDDHSHRGGASGGGGLLGGGGGEDETEAEDEDEAPEPQIGLATIGVVWEESEDELECFDMMEDGGAVASAATPAATGAAGGIVGAHPPPPSLTPAEEEAEGKAEHASAVDAIEAGWWEKHKCDCSQNCVAKLGPHAKELTRTMAMMGRARRKDVVKSMLIPLTKLPENINTKRKRTAGVKRKQSQTGDGPDMQDDAGAPPAGGEMGDAHGNMPLPAHGDDPVIMAGSSGVASSAPTTSASASSSNTRVRASYMMFGEKVCASAFQALTMLSKKAISEILREVQETHAPFPDTPMRAATTKGQHSQSTGYALRFLEAYAMSSACIFPAGRKGKIAALLSPDDTKMEVYRTYCRSDLFPVQDTAPSKGHRKKAHALGGSTPAAAAAGTVAAGGMALAPVTEALQLHAAAGVIPAPSVEMSGEGGTHAMEGIEGMDAHKAVGVGGMSGLPVPLTQADGAMGVQHPSGAAAAALPASTTASSPTTTTTPSSAAVAASSSASALAPASSSSGAASSPMFPLSYNSFTELWKKYLPWLRAHADGADTCEGCVRIRGDMLLTRIHRSIATLERESYAAQIRASRDVPGVFYHVTFNVSDRVLLPHLARLPAPMFFASRLAFDMFTVCNETVGEQRVCCLPEGQWPGEKSVNTIISMLHHCLETSSWSAKCRLLRKLALHGGSGFGSGKSRWVLYYLSWRVSCGFEDEVTLSSLVQGHDRYINDGGLALIKQGMSKTDVLTPHQMMDHVAHSTAQFNAPVPASRIQWYDWKAFLGQYYDKRLPVSAHHVFKFQKATFGTVWCQEVTNSSEVKEYPLVRDGMAAQTIRAGRGTLEHFPLLIKSLEPSRIEYLTSNVLNLSPQPDLDFFAPL